MDCFLHLRICVKLVCGHGLILHIVKCVDEEAYRLWLVLINLCLHLSLE